MHKSQIQGQLGHILRKLQYIGHPTKEKVQHIEVYQQWGHFARIIKELINGVMMFVKGSMKKKKDGHIDFWHFLKDFNSL